MGRFTALSYFVDFFITVSLMLRQKYYEGVPIIITGGKKLLYL